MSPYLQNHYTRRLSLNEGSTEKFRVLVYVGIYDDYDVYLGGNLFVSLCSDPHSLPGERLTRLLSQKC